MVLRDRLITQTTCQHPYQIDYFEAAHVALLSFFFKRLISTTGHIPSEDTTAHIPLYPHVSIVV